MSIGWLVLLLSLWGWHYRKLKQRIHNQLNDIKELQVKHDELESVLVRRGHRLDVLFSAINEVVVRVDNLGRVLSANDHARDVFSIHALPEIPESMIMYFRDPAWHKKFLKALKRLPKASSLPKMKIGKQVFAPKLAPLGKEQALLLCVDLTEMLAMEKRRKDLFANLMHDLKTPLTSMLGYARSIETFDDDPELHREAVNVIAESSKRVSGLLDELLALDQIESLEDQDMGKQENSDFRAVCDRALEMIQAKLDAKHLILDVVVSEDVTSILIRQDELMRIIGNVLDNAIRYSPEHGVIMIRATMMDALCALTICDEGYGVSDVHLSKLTERFYRVDDVRSQSEGHGLGLAIVKELLDARGGSVSIDHVEPHGLAVTLKLPIQT